MLKKIGGAKYALFNVIPIECLVGLMAGGVWSCSKASLCFYRRGANKSQIGAKWSQPTEPERSLLIARSAKLRPARVAIFLSFSLWWNLAHFSHANSRIADCKDFQQQTRQRGRQQVWPKVFKLIHIPISTGQTFAQEIFIFYKLENILIKSTGSLQRIAVV